MYRIAFFAAHGDFILPVNPSKMPVKESADHASVTILALGEAIRPGMRKLRSYEIESFFPAEDADAGVAYFSELLAGQAACRMIYSRDENEPENVEVVLQSFDREERGGEPGAVHYKLSLKEFRAIQAKVLS